MTGNESQEPPRKKQKLNNEQVKSCASVADVLSQFVDRCEEEIPCLGLVNSRKNKEYKFINAPVSGQHIGLVSLLRKVVTRKHFFEIKNRKTTQIPNDIENDKKIEKSVLSDLLKNAIVSKLVNVSDYFCEIHTYAKVFYAELDLSINPCFVWKPSHTEEQTTTIKIIISYNCAYLPSGEVEDESNLTLKFGMKSRTLARYFSQQKKNSKKEAIFPLFYTQYGYIEIDDNYQNFRGAIDKLICLLLNQVPELKDKDMSKKIRNKEEANLVELVAQLVPEEALPLELLKVIVS